MKTALGILATAVVLFVFGFLYWGANPLPGKTMNALPDPEAAAAAVSEQFPDSGIYSVLAPATAPSGVSAMVIVDHDVSGKEADPLVMFYGFVHYIAIGIVLALVLQRGAALADHVKRAALLGVAAVVLVEGSDLVWWGYPLAWKLWGAVYHVLVFVIGALVLSKFLPPSDAEG